MGPSRMYIPVGLHGEVHVQAQRRFTQPIRLLQVWHSPCSLQPQPCPVNHQLTTPALSSTGRGVGVCVCEGWGGSPFPSWRSSHTYTPFHNLHSSLRCKTSDPGHTRAYSHLPSEDAIRGSEEFMEGTPIHTHGRVSLAQHLTHIDSHPMLLPQCRWTSSLIKCYCSRKHPMNQSFLARATN